MYPSPESPRLDDATILVTAGRISALEETASKPVAYGSHTTVIDCSGMTVTAGLWNSHVHLLPQNLLHADQKTASELAAALEGMLTRWGFTSVFDIASVLANTNAIRNRIASGEVAGPRILTTGEPFFPRDGVPSYVSQYLDANHIVLPDDSTTAAAVKRVGQEVRAGADGIKIFNSIEGQRVLLMPLDRGRVIVREAHRLHRPVFVHPSNQAGIQVAIEIGADILAHLTSDNEDWTPTLVDRLKTQHIALTPTLTLFRTEEQKAGATAALENEVVDRAVSRLRLYHAAGGEVLFGTDVGYMYQFDTSEEYALMQRAGMNFSEILASLTINPARRFGYAEHSGRVAASMDADLTVFRGDPRADIAALARVSYTIRGGKIIYRDAK